MIDPAFLQFTFIIVASAILALIFKALKQPDILAYMLFGVILGVLGKGAIPGFHYLEFFSDLGLTLLLFLVGLELSSREIKSIGKASLYAGVGQIAITLGLGYVLSLILGFHLIEALYLALALTFSSTVIVIKLLTKKHDHRKLYGRLSIGILLVQDFVAIFTLIILASFGDGGTPALGAIIFTLIKGVVIMAGVYFLSRNFFPRLFHKLSDDLDLLFLVSFAWVLAFAVFISSPIIGFNIEIGGFLAGVALANSAEHFQIISRIRPLRDVFIIMFFVFLGTNIHTSFSIHTLLLTLLFSAFVLVVTTLLTMTILGLLGYRKRTSFMTALALAQISEFSFILIGLGYKLGHVSQEIVALVVLIGIVTMVASTYLIIYSNTLYAIFGKYLNKFEIRSIIKDENEAHKLDHHVVLIGHGRKGKAILKALLAKKVTVLVVDHNPQVVDEVAGLKCNILYGDITDEEIREQAYLRKADLIISSHDAYFDNITLLDYFGRTRRRPRIVVTASTRGEALNLYKRGADFVLMPEMIAGEYISEVIKSYKDYTEQFRKFGEKDLRHYH